MTIDSAIAAIAGILTALLIGALFAVAWFQ